MNYNFGIQFFSGGGLIKIISRCHCYHCFCSFWESILLFSLGLFIIVWILNILFDNCNAWPSVSVIISSSFLEILISVCNNVRLLFCINWAVMLCRYVLMCIHFLQQRSPPILPCLQVYLSYSFFSLKSFWRTYHDIWLLGVGFTFEILLYVVIINLIKDCKKVLILPSLAQFAILPICYVCEVKFNGWDSHGSNRFLLSCINLGWGE